MAENKASTLSFAAQTSQIIDISSCTSCDGFATNVNTRSIKELEIASIKSDEVLEEKIHRYLAAGNRAKKLKKLLRKINWSIDAPGRAEIWPKLCAQHNQCNRTISAEVYWELVDKALNTSKSHDENDHNEVKPIETYPSFVDVAQCLPYYLTADGISSVNRIMHVLAEEHPMINYCPNLHAITTLLLHYISEEEAYNCVVALIFCDTKIFLSTTQMLNAIIAQLVQQMSKRFASHAILALQELCPNTAQEEIFKNWTSWLFLGLSFQHLVRIMDCYLHEGIKVFYRVNFIVLRLFATDWNLVDSLTPDLIKHNVNAAIIMFCKDLPLTPAQLLSEAFKVSNFSSVYIDKQYKIADEIIKKRIESGLLNRNADRQFNVWTISHSQIFREQVQASTWQKTLFKLWTWMPARISVVQPMPLYSTKELKPSRNILFEYMTQNEPTLLLIETQTNEMFGVYSATRWPKPNDDVQKDEGLLPIHNENSESFLFSLHPKNAKYSLTGDGNDDDDDIGMKSSETDCANDSCNKETCECNAIWLDENLKYGSTKRCNAFNCPSLCALGDFEVLLLQVFTFADIKRQ